ncbi:undecaprenyldiphospho-muramoylpentapeptide beta-N-acetylglucosaminyltransferase [Pseudidiomarina gelatinasegens]|jgi:UDP-N-acetylglucosamine--N-acetylmuramyl-(pentapeptide) pyrophosphoryl-undecaprenol N-acetylglucosamine transferase|uniref:UDP-N-acetylglucosamine--N-acetylmuramyl-(pentapeptide) pyrophosphoryl-undecaprenol N-acetylglucosamine transferase n=1 Tax=Pseudidiomarina gelatinasegens TaxID=2487740 RepID=A0A451GDY3_9GAMM|nr:undecaprenyldiphospho-muramoylpentapeptide beta-N-acetylglucosaminyltransferase [Pseudidiomarina gelatinasegens]RWU11132.1 undecaprenyldiphospho-muramoylpentapeptide beta-N-acetylglucosaminyltransferase [Pseudidiomarina gelatinasegens]
MNRIMIAAAGTGGHVFPALAVAEQLRSYGWEVVWLGTTEQRLESKVVPAAGFKLEQITMQGMRGHGVMRKLGTPWRLFKAFLQCRKLLKRHRSQLLLTFGGYVCGPAGLAARSLSVPLLVHEQNAVAGLTNKLLARFAQHVMLGFGAAKKQLPMAEITGNPLRANWSAKEVATSTDGKLKLLIVGGSLGAQALNEAVPAAIAQLDAALQKNLIVQHQCGQGREAAVKAAYGPVTAQVQVEEFITDMHRAYSSADIVICRAGALTVAELAVVGTPAIFVPLPHAVDDHQTANARELVEAGAARLLPQSELVQIEPLVQVLNELLRDEEMRRAMQKHAAQAAYPNATEAVVNQCERWANPEKLTVGIK